jgi:hypothetical protein
MVEITTILWKAGNVGLTNGWNQARSGRIMHRGTTPSPQRTFSLSRGALRPRLFCRPYAQCRNARP